MRVSVIIPAYNAESTLGATLASVTQQTWSDLEIIVINDGSRDGTLAVIHDAAKADSRIVVVDQANTGVAEARNAGLRLATGEFIAILDADDIWHPTKIAKQVDRFATAPNDTVAVYCWSRVIDEDDKVIVTLPGLTAEGPIIARHVYQNVTGNGSTLMVRRDVALKVGGFSDLLRRAGVPGTDDQLFQMKVAERGGLALVPEYLVGYRRSASAFTADKPKVARSLQMTLTLFRETNSQVPDYVYRWSEAAFAFDLIGYYVRRRRILTALESLWTALRFDPIMVADRVRKYALKRLRRVNEGATGLGFSQVNPTADLIKDSGLHARRMQKLTQIDLRLKTDTAEKRSGGGYTPSYARV